MLGDFEAYLEKMLLPGTWGDQTEVNALEELLERRIIVHQEDGTLVQPALSTEDTTSLLTLHLATLASP